MQQAQTIPPKGLYSLKVSDFTKGLGIVLFGSITAAILFLLEQDHWPTWLEWRPYAITAATTLFGYIGKNFFTNNVGEVFTSDKPVVTVDATELKKDIR